MQLPSDDLGARRQRVRQAIAAENSWLPKADANGHSPDNPAAWHTPAGMISAEDFVNGWNGWHVPADAPNLTGGPTDHINDQSMMRGATAETASTPPAPHRHTPLEALRPGTLPNPGPPTYQQQLDEARQSGRTMDMLALINRPIIESMRMGISVQEWHQHGYGDRPTYL